MLCSRYLLSQQRNTDFLRATASSRVTKFLCEPQPSSAVLVLLSSKALHKTHPSERVMSSTLNVARYTALASGIVYGIYHHRSLQKAHDQEKEHHAIRRREQLVSQARDAWHQKKQGAKGDGVITDPEDPRFDLEKLFAKWEREYQ